MPKKTNGSSEFSRDKEFSVILERLETNFKVFGEGQMSLKREVDGVKETLGRTLEKVTGLELRIISLKNTTDKILADTTEIKKAVANHENRITRLETSKA